MIPRYTREEMGHIWSERNEFDTMLLVETLASEAQAELGVIPKEAAKTIREKGNFDVERIHEIEKETNHDIISFEPVSSRCIYSRRSLQKQGGLQVQKL